MGLLPDVDEYRLKNALRRQRAVLISGKFI
jgi:hypothetical protein